MSFLEWKWLNFEYEVIKICYMVSAWQWISIASGNGLVPSGNKPLPEPTWQRPMISYPSTKNVITWWGWKMCISICLDIYFSPTIISWWLWIFGFQLKAPYSYVVVGVRNSKFVISLSSEWMFTEIQCGFLVFFSKTETSKGLSC